MRTPTIPNLNTIEPELRQLLDDMLKCIDNISFGDNNGNKDRNIDCGFVSGTTNAAPNTETTHAHNLKRTPVGYIIIKKDKAGDIYNSAAHTTSLIKLKCTIASVNFTAIVF